MKTIVQCDFDGTITDKDVSFLLLDYFGDGSWRQMLKEYQDGKMSVGAFNRKAFAMIKADRETLLDMVFNSGKITIRPGFRELLDYCSAKGLDFAIVSNGQDFYIEAMLEDLGIKNIEFFSARSRFSPEGLLVKYIGPDGNEVEDRFKDVYTELFLNRGYRVIYIGNGLSDFNPARLSYHAFATGDLLSLCRKNNLDCTPFDDLNDVVKGLELLSLD